MSCRVVSCQGVGPHGFSVWGHASHKCINGTGCTAIDKKGECHEKGGPHWMVQETAWYGQDSKLGKQWYIRILTQMVFLIPVVRYALFTALQASICGHASPTRRSARIQHGEYLC